MKHSAWQARILDELEQLSDEGREAAALLRSRGTHVGFGLARRNVAAFWTPLGNIRLNSRYFTPAQSSRNLELLALLYHEVIHLEQGPLMALSVRGELEAWQRQFLLLKKLGRATEHPAIRELLTLPLTWDRRVLRRARELMQDYAGKGYLAHLLPLYPILRELRYWLRSLPWMTNPPTDE